MTGRALKPALSLRPSSRSGLASRSSSQSSTRSYRSCTPSPRATTTTSERTCYFSLPPTTAGVEESWNTSTAQVTSSSVFVNTQKTSAAESSQIIEHSRPIAIPSRDKISPSLPPLSAREDLRQPGGYFPFHDDISAYKPPTFAYDITSASPSKGSAKAPSSHNSPAVAPYGTFSPGGHSITTAPLPNTTTLNDNTSFRRPPLRKTPNTSAFLATMSQGKYHPSNYKSPNAPDASSTQTQSTIQNLLPSASAQDIRRKLQQYQRDMVEQAAMAARLHMPLALPRSPKLVPLGSPGPVTPWELDGENGGFPGFGKEGSGAAMSGNGSSTATST